MSGIAGVYHRDGRPADSALLQKMAGAMAHRGPNGIRYWSSGAVGLAHLAFNTTPESVLERQPFASNDGRLVLTLDGRVDNRDELGAALRGKGFVPRTFTDAELVLLAYQCWGDECAQQIIGDFAFVIWDADRQCLFAARDLLGVRPFFYAISGASLFFASELPALLAVPGVDQATNLGMLGEYLVRQVTQWEETLYRGIRRLPPGHRLQVDRDSLRVSRAIRLDPAHEIRYRTDGEYAEHFLEIFKRAVASHLRSLTPVSVFLSGGVDSSSILGVAAHLQRTGAAGDAALRAYGLTFSDPEADERLYQDVAVAAWGGAFYTAPGDDAGTEALAGQVERYRDLPDWPNLSMWSPLCAMTRAHGSRVGLWGYGGDEWFTGSLSHSADLLRQFRFLALARQVRSDVAVANQWGGGRVSLYHALRYWCLSPLVPEWLRAAKRRFRTSLPPWIEPGFARSISLSDRLAGSHAYLHYPTEPQRAIHNLIVSGPVNLEYELVNRFEARHGIEGRAPFNDRRVIEFSLGIPESQRWRGRQTKYVVREAMRGLVPESIRQRASKSDFTCTYRNALMREGLGGTQPPAPSLVAMGCVSGAEVGKMQRKVLDGDILASVPLWSVFALDRWCTGKHMKEQPNA